MNWDQNREKASMAYNLLFPNEETKAAAFDRLAKMYYINNFGTFPKAESDLLLFSEYLERAMACCEDEDKYSDYSLSQLLGISQSRVRSLKEKKELKYPREYSWQEEFWKVCEKAEYENGKVRLYLRDNRLYTDLCHMLETLGSYSETTLTRQLIVVQPAAFVDLMVAASDDGDKKAMRAKLQEILEKNKIDPDQYIEKDKTFREMLKSAGGAIAEEVLAQALGEVAGKGVYKGVNKLWGEVQASIKKKNAI